MKNQYLSLDQDKITSHSAAFEEIALQELADLEVIEQYAAEDLWETEYKTYLADRH